MPNNIPKHGFKFDIAISLLKEDLSYAQSLFEVFNQYELKTFLYPHNQSEIANNNGIDVFTKTFRDDARVVVLLYRQGYGDTYYTRIEHSAIQERYLKEGAGFCVLIPLDDNKPAWFPAFQIYTSNKMSSKEIGELILHKLVDLGGELKQKSFEEYINDGIQLWKNKSKHYRELSTVPSFEYFKTEMKNVQSKFEEKCDFLMQNSLPFYKQTDGLYEGAFRHELVVDSFTFTAYYTPNNDNLAYGNFPGASSQYFTLHLEIYREKANINDWFIRNEKFKINLRPDNTSGWSKIILLGASVESYKTRLLDLNEQSYYDLDSIIYSTNELLEQWFSDYIKIVFDNCKI
jgi:hypothetical protein